jgi:hypothetical protein
LLAAAFAIVLVAAGLSLRTLTGRGARASDRSRRGTVPNGARPIAEEPALAAVTAISSRRRRFRPSRLVASHDSGREPDQLRIVRRVEQKGGGRSSHARRQRTATPPRPPSESSDPGQFSVLGARIYLAQPQSIDSPGTLLVQLSLFVEGDRRRWETGMLGSGGPFRVSREDLEESVRALVVPDYLPALAEALGNGGLDIGPKELNKLTFAVEPSIEVERAIAKRGDALPIAG